VKIELNFNAIIFLIKEYEMRTFTTGKIAICFFSFACSLTGTTAAQTDTAYRENYDRHCSLVTELVEPIRNIAFTKFDKKKSKVIRNGDFTGYKFSPEPSLQVTIVLGEDEKKILSYVEAGEPYLRKKNINADRIRKKLLIQPQEELPTHIDCEYGTINVIGKKTITKITIEIPVD
jgi:hypothetical protein